MLLQSNAAAPARGARGPRGPHALWWSPLVAGAGRGGPGGGGAPTAAVVALAAAPVLAPPAPAAPEVPPLAPAPAPAPPPAHHAWGDGGGLSVAQFTAAVAALPLQRKVRWRSLYPAIGEGSRGKVFQAVNLDTGGTLAVKVVSLAAAFGPGREAALRREALVLELAALQDHDHPHLLAMQGFHFRPHPRRPELEIFSELGVCLEDMLPGGGAGGAGRGGEALGLGLVQKVMRSLLSGLEHLHARGVVHRRARGSRARGAAPAPRSMRGRLTPPPPRPRAAACCRSRCRDVKPGNVVAVGRRGTFKLIDMDSVFFAAGLPQEREQEQASGGAGGDAGGDAPPARPAAPRRRRAAHARAMGRPGPGAAAAALAGAAAARVAAVAALDAQLALGSLDGSLDGACHWGELNALTHAGTPENVAPEAAPRVLRRARVLWDVLPLRAGRQAPGNASPHPAQDIWAAGTVLYELLAGRALWSAFDSPEALYEHYAALQLARDPRRCCPRRRRAPTPTQPPCSRRACRAGS
ncbi:mkh1 [Scenedesmus sp. PABB004]|nr:mkh1 [Scenedesmus sp. PABB004]